MPQDVTNLNSPPQGPEVLERKSGKLASAWAAWFAALGAVASWAVAGALSAGSLTVSGAATIGGALTAASATITGLLTAGSLNLTTAAVTPANGKQYAGDAAWIALVVNAPYTNTGGGVPSAQVRKLSDGWVCLEGAVNFNGAALGSVIATLPAAYRPANALRFAVVAQGAYATFNVAANGDISQLQGSVAASVFFNVGFYAEA